MNKQHDMETIKSKSQLKRDANALLDLGVELVGLQQKSLDKIPLEGQILDAVNEARRITAHGGLKRQRQYLAKLLRQINTDKITDALHQLQIQSSQTNLNFKNTERWRDRLIHDKESALREFIDNYPHVDKQKLRQLIRNATKEIANQNPPKHYRELFRLLRNTIEQL